MASLLKMNAVDRSSMILKRFSSANNVNLYQQSTGGDPASAYEPLQKLPTFAGLDTRSFVNMFDAMHQSTHSADSVRHHGDVSPVTPSSTDDTPTSSHVRLQQFHSECDEEKEVAFPSSRTLESLATLSKASISRMRYRLSTSSSGRSRESDLSLCRDRDLSLCRDRDSSASSITGDVSMSDRSLKGSDKEAVGVATTKPQVEKKHHRVTFLEDDLSTPAFSSLFPADKNKPLPEAPAYRSEASGLELDGSSAPRAVEIQDASPIVKRGARLGRAMTVDGQVRLRSSRIALEHVDAIPKSMSLPQMTSSEHTVVPQDRTSKSLRQSPSKRTRSDPSALDVRQRPFLRILSRLDNLEDLRSASTIDRSFYETFKRHEAMLVSRALWGSSSAGWELRQLASVSERSSPFKFRSFCKDLATLSALESFVLMQCQRVCRPATIECFMNGPSVRKTELEDALWRIWTFCKLFGKSSGKDYPLSKQALWLNGGQREQKDRRISFFGVGNGAGLTLAQLEDMSELWRCMETLMSGFRGRVDDARRVGVFESCVVDEETSERDLLDSWMYDILSLGPKAVLTLSSCDFEQAKVLGVTKWTPPSRGKSRNNFLKAAIEEVYRERLVTEAKRKAAEYKRSLQVNHQRSVSDEAVRSSPPPRPDRPAPSPPGLGQSTQVVSQQSLLGQAQSSPRGPALQVLPDCDPMSSRSSLPSTSPTTNPLAFSSLSMTPTISTRVGPTLFPYPKLLPSALLEEPQPIRGSTTTDSSSDHEVIDPVDSAVATLVDEMGFDETSAKRALAMCDTGSGVDLDQAIELLSADAKGFTVKPRTEPVELPASPRSPRKIPSEHSDTFCEGTCHRVLVTEPKRDRSQGAGVVKRGFSVRKSFRRSPALSPIVDVEDGTEQENEQEQSAISQFYGSGGLKRSSTLGHLVGHRLLNPLLLNTAVVPSKGESGSGIPVSPITTVFEVDEPTSPVSCSSPPRPPRVTLTRVGTGRGTQRRGWNLGTIRKKAGDDAADSKEDSRRSGDLGEVIGYSY